MRNGAVLQLRPGGPAPQQPTAGDLWRAIPPVADTPDPETFKMATGYAAKGAIKVAVIGDAGVLAGVDELRLQELVDALIMQLRPRARDGAL